MEATGVALDREALAALDVEFRGEIERLEAEIYADVGHEFNLGSPKQLEQVLFFELNLPKGKRTKTGYSTDASVLEELRAAHPMVDKLLDWRIYTKLRSTYVEALPTLHRRGRSAPHDVPPGRRRHRTALVVRPEPPEHPDPHRRSGRRIRRAFVAGAPELTPGRRRLLARSSCGSSPTSRATSTSATPSPAAPTSTARRPPGCSTRTPAEVTADERSMAKMVNFGIAYGMSDFGLSSRAGIPRKEAQEFINTYFATYSGISYYMLHIKETARTQGSVTTLLGRKRQIPELRAQPEPPGGRRADGDQHADPGHGRRHHEDRDDPARRARCADEGFRARLLLQVHDELLLEVPRDEIDRLVPVLRATMESALALDVPLTVDVKVGADWESMTPLTRADALAAEADEPLEAPIAGA